MARLPSVGGDNGQWGQILNDFLSVEHNSDGTLKKAGDISTALSTANAAQIDANNAQSTANSKYTKPGSGIPESDLDSSVQTKLNAGASGVPDATSSIKGKLQLAGDLTGTASSPQIAAGAVSDAKIAIGANIGQSKIQNLTSDLAAKYVKPGSGIPLGDLTSGIQASLGKADTSEQAANKGQAGGYASLDGAGKVPASQLPNAIMRYQGVWNASTNSPMLTDGSGDAGDVYRVSAAGTQNLGSGSISFEIGDYVVYNPSGVWEKSDTTDSVASVAGKTGVVTLTSSDVGLGNVPNTNATLRANHTGTQVASTISDFDAAADARITAQKGQLGGLATLDGTGKIPGTQLPALAITNTFAVNSQAAQLALAAQEGDLAIRSDQGKTYVHNGGTAGTMADWSELLSVGDQAGLATKVSKSGDTMTGALAISNAGGKNTLQLTSTSANTGITLGGDTTLYRNSANILRTDGGFMLNGNFSSQNGTGSGYAYFSGTLTDTASTATLGMSVNTNISPASTSASEFRSLGMSANVAGAQDFSNTIKGAHLETRWQGSGNMSGYVHGAQGLNIIPSTAVSFGTIANTVGVSGQGVTEFASTAISGTVTTATSLMALSNSRTNITIQNTIGVDVHGQNVGTASNIGVRIARSATYSLQLTDTGGSASGGITFATDTNLYRSAADTLKTDDVFIAGLGVNANSNRITNVATPTTGTDAATKSYVDTAGGSYVLRAGDTMTGGLLLSSTATGGLQSYNTADQTTNYERGTGRWNSNVYQLGTEYGGTGTIRNLQVGIATVAGNNALTRYMQVSAFGSPFVFHSGTQSAAGTVAAFGSASSFLTASSGTQNYVGITPNIFQTGTAGYTALQINATESTVGSGSKLLIDAQVGSTSKFSVTTTGVTSIASTATTGLNLYNTADQTTNYERLRISWSSGVSYIVNEQGGTGLGREIYIGSTTANGLLIGNSNNAFTFSRSSTAIASLMGITSTGLAGTGGTQFGLQINPVINQSSAAGYTMLLVNPSHTATGSGNKLLADFQVGNASKAVIDANGYIGIAATSSVPTAPITIGSTQAANGIALFDSSDQTTNYSRLRIIDTSNVFNIVTEWGGTGLARVLRIGTAATAGSVNSRFIEFNAAAPFYRFTFGSTGLTGNMIDMTNSTFSQASAQSAALALNPTISQGGTAGYTMLLVNPTETSTGSGNKLLADFQVGGVSQASIDSAGNVSGKRIVANTNLTVGTVVRNASISLTVFNGGVNLFNAASGAMTATLPSAVGLGGIQFTVKKIDSTGNAVTVMTTSSQTIDGATTYALATQYKYVTVASDGTNWYVIANN